MSGRNKRIKLKDAIKLVAPDVLNSVAIGDELIEAGPMSEKPKHVMTEDGEEGHVKLPMCWRRGKKVTLAEDESCDDCWFKRENNKCYFEGRIDEETLQETS